MARRTGPMLCGPDVHHNQKDMLPAPAGVAPEYHRHVSRLLFTEGGCGRKQVQPNRRAIRTDATQPVRVLKCQSGAEYLDRVEIELGVQTALDVVGLAKAVLL